MTQNITFEFDPPGEGAVDQVEIFTNLNRRDLARVDKNGDNVPDGIVAIDGNSISSSAADTDPATGYYYAAFVMSYNAETKKYELTIPASKTGAYRVTARYRTSSDGPWIWWGLRDHAVVVALLMRVISICMRSTSLISKPPVIPSPPAQPQKTFITEQAQPITTLTGGILIIYQALGATGFGFSRSTQTELTVVNLLQVTVMVGPCMIPVVPMPLKTFSKLTSL